ncbi:MAG: SGNH/GDSL hydrolase family protein [Pseudomonadota bacterium]
MEHSERRRLLGHPLPRRAGWSRRDLLRAVAVGGAAALTMPLIAPLRLLGGGFGCRCGGHTIHPPLVQAEEIVGGRTLRYMRFKPDQVYRDIEMPDFPFYVGIGDPDPYRRKRYYGCTTNRHGFRGPRDWSPEKPPGTFRIACIGDGITFGEGVDDRLDFPYLLQDLLSETPGAPVLEVLNLGTPCRLTDEGVPFLEIVAARFQVDFYFLILGVNDALPMFLRPLPMYREALDRLLGLAEAKGLACTVVRDPANTFFPEPARYAEYSRAFAEVLGERFPLVDLPALLDVRERWEGLRWEGNPDGLQRLVRYREGQPEVLVEAHRAPDTPQRPIAREIYEYLDANPVSCATFITDCHLNEAGHRLAAAALRDHLAQRRPWAEDRAAPPAPAAPGPPGR